MYRETGLRYTDFALHLGTTCKELIQILNAHKSLDLTSSRTGSFPKFCFISNLVLIYERLTCVNSHLFSLLGH
jgi:hypothetical protein